MRDRLNLLHGERVRMIHRKGADAAPTSRSTRLALREWGIARRTARCRATEPPSYSAEQANPPIAQSGWAGA